MLLNALPMTPDVANRIASLDWPRDADRLANRQRTWASMHRLTCVPHSVGSQCASFPSCDPDDILSGCCGYARTPSFRADRPRTANGDLSRPAPFGALAQR
mgnify:CR=1 FL=1